MEYVYDDHHVGHDENTRYYLEQDGKKWELHTANEEKDLGLELSHLAI